MEKLEGPGAYKLGTRILYTTELLGKEYDEAREAETLRDAVNIAKQWKAEDRGLEETQYLSPF